MDHLKGIACPTPSNRASYLTHEVMGHFKRENCRKKDLRDTLEIFLGFDFCPPFDQPSHFNSGEPSSTLVYL